MATALARTLGLALLVLLSTGRSVANGFAFDDVLILVKNDEVHRLDPPWVYAQQSYWPPRNMGAAYRPLTIWGFAAQWAVSGGHPRLFHAVSMLLYLGVVLLFYALARRLLSPGPAWGAAALFAVHPVHVEATGNVVGQAELWMAGLVIAAVWVYLRERERGALDMGTRLALAGLLVLASAAKEQGIFLPVMLLAVEATVVRDPRPWRERARSLTPVYVLLGLTGAAFLAARYLVLGDLGGGPVALGLQGLAPGGRALVMLPLVQHWARLLLWPAHLQAQYTPPGFGGSAAWSAGAWAGVALVLGGAVCAALALWRRRQPVIALGLLWTAAALAPVSNVLFPTGILIAERTLFLPSVGAMLAAGGLLSAGCRVQSAERRLQRAGCWLLLGLLVLLGTARSWSRQAVWRDNLTLFAQTIVDAPTSYRGFYLYGQELQAARRPLAAIEMYRTAGTLYEGDRRVFEEWGQVLRAQGRCDEAVPVLKRAVRADPTETVGRARLIECLIRLKDYSEARAAAEEGIRVGGPAFRSQLRRVDSLTNLGTGGKQQGTGDRRPQPGTGGRG